MSRYRQSRERERRQEDEDHKIIWGVIRNKEDILSQLTSAVRQSAVPGTFLHFLQQGDFSDEALTSFDPEALEIMQSMRILKQQKDEHEALMLSEWHAEWVQSEQQQRHGPASINSSLLTKPANIDLCTHVTKAEGAVLNYYGGEEEAPDGTLKQKKRWTKEAEKHRATQDENFGTQGAPIVVLSSPAGTALFQQLSVSDG
ncbi:hypothetical protein N0V90_012522 [Kalmusia sp. IMI 367209]|nr:hypothetical protein N0V90_012522 [Kalmusia sp. IMI 367209]